MDHAYDYTDVIKVWPPYTFFDFPFCTCNEFFTYEYYTLPECTDTPITETPDECLDNENCHRPCHLKHIATNGECSAWNKKYSPSDY